MGLGRGWRGDKVSLGVARPTLSSARSEALT